MHNSCVNNCWHFILGLSDAPHESADSKGTSDDESGGLQVAGEQLQQVLQEVRGRITPEEGRALVSRALRDRDQADSDKWQVLPHPF